MLKWGQEDNMANGTKILDNGIIFHSFTMGGIVNISIATDNHNNFAGQYQ